MFAKAFRANRLFLLRQPGGAKQTWQGVFARPILDNYLLFLQQPSKTKLPKKGKWQSHFVTLYHCSGNSHFYSLGVRKASQKDFYGFLEWQNHGLPLSVRWREGCHHHAPEQHHRPSHCSTSEVLCPLFLEHQSTQLRECVSVLI